MFFINIIIYLLAIFIDSMCFVFMINLGLGAYPYAIFVENLAVLTHLSFGMVSFIFGYIQIYLASRFRKTRIKYELLLYSFIFSMFVDVEVFLIRDMPEFSFLGNLMFLVMLIFILDLSRALFQLVNFPKLSFVELLVGMKERFGYDFKKSTRINNVLLFVIGIALSFANGVPFQGVGIGTLLSIYLSGVGHNYYTPKVQAIYSKIKRRISKS